MKYKTRLLKCRKVLRWRIRELRRLNGIYKPIKQTWYRDFGFGGYYEFHEKLYNENRREYYKLCAEYHRMPTTEYNYCKEYLDKFTRTERLISIKLALLPRFCKDLVEEIAKYVD